MEEKKLEVEEEIKTSQTDDLKPTTAEPVVEQPVEKTDVENNDNKFVKALKAFGHYIKFIFYDFFTSFKYNKMKLPGLLIAVPGVFLGFFLKFHNPVVRQLSFQYFENGNKVTLFTYDVSAIVLFILVLFGILNIFTAVSCMSKKSRGSVITATITTVVIVAAGIFYLVLLIIYSNLLATGKISADIPDDFNFNYWLSFISVLISIIASVAGCILGFIFYDRNYKKVKF